MTQEFPNPCAQCGFCCISEVCAFGKLLGARSDAPCEHLRFGPDGAAHCHIVTSNPDSAVVRQMFGVGAGCCISARLGNSQTGEMVDFASQSPATKHAVVRCFAEGSATLVSKVG